MRDRNTTVRCATRAHAAGLLLAAALALPAGAVTTQMSETLASLGFTPAGRGIPDRRRRHRGFLAQNPQSDAA